jgi:hypothetical protein
MTEQKKSPFSCLVPLSRFHRHALSALLSGERLRERVSKGSISALITEDGKEAEV